MGDKISSEEAARRLSITQRRVQELVKAGSLSAEKVSGVWLIDADSVDKRAREVNKRGGRPARGKGANEATFTLMNRTHEIAEVVYDAKRMEFTSFGELVDEARAPIGVAPAGGRILLADFNRWWRNRGIPITRLGLDRLLRDAGVAVPEELIQRNLGLSLSDQYWIRPAESHLAWEEVNFFHNDFEEVAEHTAPYASSPSVRAEPANTSDGNLEKTWIVRDGARLLQKGSSHNGQEPYNEVVATALHRRLLSPGCYVEYTLEGEGASAFSLCADFIADDEEYIPAMYVQRTLTEQVGRNEYEHYLACCEALGAHGAKEALDQMIICDDIIANHDRHFRNFGIVRNVETLGCRPAPLFDSGSSLWCDVDEKTLAQGERGFSSRQFYPNPARQLLLVEDFSWFDASRLEGFVDEAIAILAGNEALERRLPYIRSALEWRIGRMADIAEWS
ncbi:MAG: DNA-binding protein [Eggerthellaceae bacterium]|nr:DNA-binding protein [Eggerthellaceae bacterium]